MYCRRCGNPLEDTDLFCSVCGTKINRVSNTGSPVEAEEIVFNAPPEEQGSSSAQAEEGLTAEASVENRLTPETPAEEQPTPERPEEEPESRKSNEEFSWNIYDFPKPKRTEDINFHWGVDQPDNEEAELPLREAEEAEEAEDAMGKFLDAELTAEKRDTEPVWFTEPQPEPQPIEAEIEPKAEEIGPETAEADPADAEPEPLIAGIRGVAEADIFAQPAPEDRTDKFYTFSKKNEEFQKLLDKEYAKIRERENSPSIANNETIRRKMQENAAATQGIPGAVAADEAQEAATELPEEIKESTEPAGGIAEEFAAFVSGVNAEPAEEQTEDLAQAPAAPKPPRTTFSGQEDLGARLEALWGGSIGASLEKEKEQLARSALVAAEESEIPAVAEIVPDITEEKADESAAEEIASEITQEAIPPVTEEEPVSEAPAEAVPETPPFVFRPEEEAPPIMGTGQSDQDGSEETGHKKHGCSFVVLIIVVILLAIELAALGIKMFLPDTAYAQTINDAQTKIVLFLVDAKDTVTGWFGGSGQDEEEADEDAEEVDGEDIEPVEEPLPEQEEIDHSPAADLDTLVASQLYANKNIGEVKADPELKYTAGRDYGQADINNSTAIADNYWATAEDGEILYYDRKIVETLIGFDSAWNEYVNGGSDEVLAYTKEGSTARKNAENFSKVGKVTQVFKLLEIGEIRQGEKGFYAWTYEEISETQGSKTAEKKYHWIYRLEPVGNEMKIVNYYKY